MTPITFKFDVDQWVTSILGQRGVVRMLAVDRSGVRYSIDYTTPDGVKSEWFFENELSASPSGPVGA